MNILVTGSAGFIGSYLCQELLSHGHSVLGIDNYSKYGKVSRPHDSHPRYVFYERDVNFMDEICQTYKPDIIVAGAAMIGGIGMFHTKAYSLLAHNDRLTASTFDSAIQGWKEGWLKRIVVLSSSMVYENSEVWPTPETEARLCPSPSSTYGFNKLNCEVYCQGALEEYGLPYTILRPFNCVGSGEDESPLDHEAMSGNIKMMMSHVLPDLINKVLKGQSPLRILGDGSQVRCYTNGRDIARGIRLAIESEKALNEDFNISIPVATTVLELAEAVWKAIRPNDEFVYESDDPYKYDVQRRIPDCAKAKEVLGFEATIGLEESIAEVVAYMSNKVAS